MGHTKTTIELNGRIFDATTGEVLTSVPIKKPTVADQTGRVMDGFYKRPGSAAAKPTTVTPKATATKAGRKTEKSQTLMRHAVVKPATKQSAIKKRGLPAANLVPSERQERAKQTTKSSSISRFGLSVGAALNTKVIPLAVKPHPGAPAITTQAYNLAEPSHSTADAFNEALRTATSHQQKSPYSKPKLHHRAAKKIGVSSRVISLGAISLAILLLIAVVAFKNVPNASMRLAASKAGFQASLPVYTPSGFGMSGQIQASPGAVTVSFRSHSDARNFEVSQKTSNWTSESLLSSYVASASKTYQTIQDKGKTIYLYGQGNATWVNGGVWYKVTGNAQLDNDQIVSIANSL